MDFVPRSDLYDDVYFSAEGGPAETHHVFLQGNDLPHRWQGAWRHTIGETGFGTGLNFLLAWKLFDETAPPDAFLDFVSVEKHPMSAAEIGAALAHWGDALSPYLDRMLRQYPLRIPGFHRMVFEGRVALTLIFDDAHEALAQVEGQVDSWFLDGFTPSKNPQMWTPEVFAQMARLSHRETHFATFTAAGFVRRGLQEAGFHVEKRKGFGSKRDMSAGHFIGRHQEAPARSGGMDGGRVAILGAGLAGGACAYVLRQYGFDPLVYDGAGIAGGASGNPVGLANPRFTALRDAQADFYMAGYALAQRLVPSIGGGAAVRRTGALHLITDDDKRKRLSRTLDTWGWRDGHMQWLDAAQASEAAGVPLNHDALYLPDALSLSPQGLCGEWLKDTRVERMRIESLEEVEADAVILANGIGALDFYALPIHTVRGQVSFVSATPLSSRLKTSLHYGGYIAPAQDGVHGVGATFQRWLGHTDIMPEDNEYNLGNLRGAIPALAEIGEITGARASLRCAAKDRFPAIGQIDGRVYASTAHGSHGILSALIGAHYLADCLRGGIACLPRRTALALAPKRFASRG